MREVNINTLVSDIKYLIENIPNDIILVGKIEILRIKYKYDQLDLSKIECMEIQYKNQVGESIKNHILPNSLIELDCSRNQIISIPKLPNSLKFLRCYNNQLTSLPDLPNSLEFLYCYGNKLISLPKFPISLNQIDIGNINLYKIEFNPNYKNVKFYIMCSKITISDYIIKSKEDYISYMEDYEKYLLSKVKSARN